MLFICNRSGIYFVEREFFDNNLTQVSQQSLVSVAQCKLVQKPDIYETCENTLLVSRTDDLI